MPDFPISAPNAGLQQQPAVARISSATFFVAWADTVGGTIRGTALSAGGTPASDPLAVSAPAAANLRRQRPVVAPIGMNFVVAWLEQALNPPGPRPALKAQRFDSSVRKIGPEIQVNVDDVDSGQPISVCHLLDSTFAVAWAGTRADRRVLVRRFSADGVALGDAVLVSDEEGFHVRPLVCALGPGRFVVTWTRDPVAPGGGGMAMRLFDDQGPGATMRPNLFGAHAITLLGDDGRFAVAHFRDGPRSDIGAPTNHLRVDVFDRDGRSTETPIFVATARDIFSSSPALAPLPPGRLAVCWLHKAADTVTALTQVKAAVFSTETTERLGAELRLDSATAGERFVAAAGSVFGGDAGEAVCCAWDDNASAGAGGPPRSDVRARVMPLQGGGFEG